MGGEDLDECFTSRSAPIYLPLSARVLGLIDIQLLRILTSFCIFEHVQGSSSFLLSSMIVCSLALV